MAGSGAGATATISAVSSTDSVVWVRKARLSGSAGAIRSASSASRSASSALGHLAEGADHFRMAGMADEQDVPPAFSTSRSAWRWTLETSGQVASR
jgi:hypothetical protein